MEEGSLLQEALEYVKSHRRDGGLSNTLVIDAFPLQSQETTADAFVNLVALRKSLNKKLSSYTKGYPWFSGGDGPCFGVHVTDGIPHLRAVSRYGANVQDEWCGVAAVLSLSGGFVFRCWDTDDGHVLLIESAMHLPVWLDDLGPSKCRNRCWILNGRVTLIKGGSGAISLRQALNTLRQPQKKCIEAPPKITEAIQRKVGNLETERQQEWKGLIHRTAIVLPRTIATLLREHPSLIQTAVVAFDRFSPDGPPPGQIPFEDLVWTTHKLGRTSYALIRTSANAVWKSEDFIPKTYKSVETNRMKRTCQVESTPHLKSALQVGVRIVAGFDYLLGQMPKQEVPLDAEERVLKHWTALDVACGGDGEWLRNSWIAGPNRSIIDLSAFLKCPIAAVDLLEKYPFPESQPGKTSQSLIQQWMRRDSAREDKSFEVPSPQTVGREDWMQQELYNLQSIVGRSPTGDVSKMAEVEGKVNVQALDNMLGDFKAFVENESDLEGVATMSRRSEAPDLGIETDMFADVLQKMVSSAEAKVTGSVNFCNDESSSKRHYDALDGEGDEDISAVMAAMDHELRSTPASSENDFGMGVDQPNPSPTDEVKVLGHLLESLETSEAAPGPVRNILNEIRGSLDISST